MLILEYKLRTTKAQATAINEAIRVIQFIRNTCLRQWMDGRGIGDNELPVSCSALAREYPFAARLNSQARQTSADRAWLAIARFYKHCREHKPGKQGSPRFQQATRSVEYKTTGWRVEPDGKRLTFTDGTGIGTREDDGHEPRAHQDAQHGHLSRGADQASASSNGRMAILCHVLSRQNARWPANRPATRWALIWG